MAYAQGHIQLPSEGERTVHGHSAQELRAEKVMRITQISQIPGLSPARSLQPYRDCHGSRGWR